MHPCPSPQAGSVRIASRPSPLGDPTRGDAQVRNRGSLRQAFGLWLVGVLALLPGACPPLLAQDATEILRTARLNATARPMRLEGQIREGSRKMPFFLEVEPGVVRYRFPDGSPSLELRFLETQSELLEVTKDGARPAEAQKDIAGMGILQGELALEFLYWPVVSIIGEETLKTRPCYMLRLHSPVRSSLFSVVFVWVDKQTGALMRMEGHDWTGKLIRRFEVVSGQRIDGGWLLKQMRVQHIDPERGRTTRRVYMEILGEVAPSSGPQAALKRPPQDRTGLIRKRAAAPYGSSDDVSA